VSCAKSIACLGGMKLKKIMFHLALWRPVYKHIIPGFQPQTAVFDCLTNATAPPLTTLESCSRAQTHWQSSSLHSKKFFWLGVADFL